MLAFIYNKEQNNCMLIFWFKSGRATGIPAIPSAMAIGELVVTICTMYIAMIYMIPIRRVRAN